MSNGLRFFYNNRKSYVINNGYFTDVIDMQKGIFQGCPISPYLFLCVIEVAALAIRQNEHIYGIFDVELLKTFRTLKGLNDGRRHNMFC